MFFRFAHAIDTNTVATPIPMPFLAVLQWHFPIQDSAGQWIWNTVFHTP
jgi:hypothetical protein